MTAISIQGLSKRYGEINAVDGLTFRARKGTVTGFLGPNGAGKSTTLRMLLGLVSPTAGTATIGGRPYADLPDPFRHVGAVLETTGFHPGRKARDHLRVLAAAADVPLGRVDEVLELVGLAARRRQAGQGVLARNAPTPRPRGSAARRARDPDPRRARERPRSRGRPLAAQFLRGFADDGGTVLVSSHLLAEVAQTVDDVVIIANGRLVTQSSLADLAARSRSAVRVRTPQAEALRAALTAPRHRRPARRRGHAARLQTTTEAVGLAAAGAGAVIYEMTPEHFDLEEMFLELTTPEGDRAMKHLIQAELLKLRTTRSFWLYLAAALAFVPVTVALAVTGAGAGQQDGSVPLASSDGVRNVFGSAAGGTVMLLLIGIYMMAGEFRHNTATSTFLITPDRRRIVGAKLAASGFVGFVVGLAASLLTLAMALPWLSAKDVDLTAHTGDIAVVLLGVLLATTLSPIVGVGFGALVPNQTVAVTAALVWITTVEGLLVSYKPEFGRWLPGGASACAHRNRDPQRWSPADLGWRTPLRRLRARVRRRR